VFRDPLTKQDSLTKRVTLNTCKMIYYAKTLLLVLLVGVFSCTPPAEARTRGDRKGENPWESKHMYKGGTKKKQQRSPDLVFVVEDDGISVPNNAGEEDRFDIPGRRIINYNNFLFEEGDPERKSIGIHSSQFTQLTADDLGAYGGSITAIFDEGNSLRMEGILSNPLGPVTLAVVGGTGMYAGAAGEAHGVIRQIGFFESGENKSEITWSVYLM